MNTRIDPNHDGTNTIFVVNDDNQNVFSADFSRDDDADQDSAWAKVNAFLGQGA